MNIVKLDIKNESVQKGFLNLMEAGGLSSNNLPWFKWKYIDNPMFNDNYIYGAKVNGKLVGLRPFMLFNLKHETKVFNAAQPCDTVVEPDYRGQGIFTKLTKYAINEMKKEFQLFFNFPNFNSMPGYLKMGWDKTVLIDEGFAFKNFPELVKKKSGNSFFYLGSSIYNIFMTKLDKVIRELSKDSNINIIDNEERFTDEFEDLWNKNIKSRIRVYRPREYLNWRYCARPDKDYKIWTLRDGDKLKAYIITSDSDRWKVAEGQIVDFQYESLNQILILCQAI